MLELRNKSRANLDDEEEEEDMDVAESGWSRAPNLTAAAAAKPAAKKKWYSVLCRFIVRVYV